MNGQPTWFGRAARSLHLGLAAAAMLLAAPGNAADTGADVAPAALELLQAVSAKLGAAATLRLKAQHTLDPALGVGGGIDKGPIEVVVQRPNRFYAIQRAGRETREIAYDGQSLCVMHAALKHYALEPMAAESIEQFATLAAERFGFRPPIAELLANDMAAELLNGVTSARVAGVERVGWSRCTRLTLEQEGLQVDLWVRIRDGLPRRMLITFTDMQGQPTWNLRFSSWRLDVPVDTALFSKRPAADSQKVEMLKNR